MISRTIPTDTLAVDTKHDESSTAPLKAIEHAIHHAAHWLPAQGPITVFVHHNTLHALEHMPFEEAVRYAAGLFGCQPYMSQQHYRQEMARGRILQSDVSGALLDALGDEADVLIGFLGTRYNLRRAILQHPFQSVLPNEIDWVMAESRSMEKFSPETNPEEARKLVDGTRRWVGRTWNHDGQERRWTEPELILREMCKSFESEFPLRSMQNWSDAKWESFTLHLLWKICWRQVQRFPPPSDRPPVVRHRDYLLGRTGVDSDRWVNEFLIRFCVVLLDQGLSRWQLPNRNAGVLGAFINLYADGWDGPYDRWLRDLQSELQEIRSRGLSALEIIQQRLEQLGVTAQETDEYITQMLLSLRGFAGMIWQMEMRADRIAHPLPTGSLVEFVAVRLILETLALRHIVREELGSFAPLSQVRNEQQPAHLASQPPAAHGSCGDLRSEAFAIFQLAQALGWQLETLLNLPTANWKSLLEEIRAFDDFERRSIYHQAFERRLRQQVLNAMHLHSLDVTSHQPSIAKRLDVEFDVITCLDEREESFRRHIEEVAPQCRTWGAAGFFNVAMYYQAADSFQFVPLCPIVIEPQHYIQERVAHTHEEISQRRSVVRRLVGGVQHILHTRSRTLVSGALTSVLGNLASIPLVARVLFPRMTGKVRQRFDRLYSPPKDTYLHVERIDLDHHANSTHLKSAHGENVHQHPNIGFSLEEMANIVERLMRDLGFTSGWSPLVLIFGHGSSTMNNPHESAYDCGACGGGRGGPNARTLAQLANDPRVRKLLAERGLAIPDTTYFVGGFHNTCNDQIAIADQSQVPESHRVELARAVDYVIEAAQRNAHERCRRFESADLDLTPTAAYKHVMGRSEDLSQVRPECGHATNAMLIVGRRKWTRGLFLDRRAFLQSYDPTQDDAEHAILARVLAAVIPVCAGINLEYYFSHVDPEGYGCGTKLPHNIAALVGVMQGAASDLAPGLPWQMVEIHEPVRLLTIIETTPEAMLEIMARNPAIDRLVRGRWIQLATLDGETGTIYRFQNGRFVFHLPESDELPQAMDSMAWYRGWRGHLDFAQLASWVKRPKAGVGDQ